MAKNNKPASGYTVPRLVILILVATLAGLGGWWVYQKSQTDNNTQTTQSSVPYAGWQTYDDERLTFKYPPSWKITGRDISPFVWLVLEGPPDEAIKLAATNTNEDGSPASNKRLALSIGPKSSGELCRKPCKIYSVTYPKMPAAPNARLVVSDWEGSGYPNIVQLIDDPTAQADIESYRLTSQINQKQSYIFAEVNYGQQKSGGWITDLGSFLNSSSYDDLFLIVISVNFK